MYDVEDLLRRLVAATSESHVPFMIAKLFERLNSDATPDRVKEGELGNDSNRCRKPKRPASLQTVSVYLVECRGIEPLTSRVRFWMCRENSKS
jgi:hypothetical protein